MADWNQNKQASVEVSELVVLPCSGLDKEAGSLSRELALVLAGEGARLVCPVLFQHSPKRYKRDLETGRLLVVDGCRTGCASKLAKERGLRIDRKVTLTDFLKEKGLKSGKSPLVSDAAMDIVPEMLNRIQEPSAHGGPESEDLFKSPVSYRQFTVEKFVFRVPEEGYFFNENDCWARVEGNRARVGVSDYVQQSASDIVFFEPPEIGTTVEIFDDVGSLESTKTALDIISPVSGTVVAVNEHLVEKPELVNLSPYEDGWTAEIELEDFKSDRELLMDCEAYYEYMKKKASSEHRKLYGG